MKKLNDYKKQYDGLHTKFFDLKGRDALEAVKFDGYNLRYVIEQTEEICLADVKQNGFALEYVREQTEEICLAALECTIDALEYVNPNLFYKNHKKLLEGLEEV